MDVPARLLTPTARMPSRAHEDDAAYDLHADQDLLLEPGRRATVRTGVAVALPPGSAGLVVPRSGIAARHGVSVVNGPGLIDPGYRGEIAVILLNTDLDEPFEISVGDRVAQLLIVETAGHRLVEVTEELGETTRGAGGFGSTGR
jgi:dUTP pyrophosphatase